MENKNRVIEYSVPFTVVVENTGGTKDSLKIKGTAMKFDVSRNNNFYEAHEVDTKSLETRPISMGHSKKEDRGNPRDVVGIVTRSWNTGEGIDYEGTIYNTNDYPDIVQRVERGLIPHVSIEATVEDAEEIEKEGKMVYAVKGAEFVKLGLVDVPGFKDSSIAMAEAFGTLFKKDNKEVKEMAEEDTKPVEEPKPVEPTPVEPTPAAPAEPKEPSPTESLLSELISEKLKTSESEVTKVNERLKKIEEALAQPAVKPTVSEAAEDKPRYEIKMESRETYAELPSDFFKVKG